MGHKYNQECFHKREAEGDLTTETEDNVGIEARYYAAVFEDDEKSHEPRNVKNVAESWKRQ